MCILIAIFRKHLSQLCRHPEVTEHAVIIEVSSFGTMEN